MEKLLKEMKDEPIDEKLCREVSAKFKYDHFFVVFWIWVYTNENS